MAYVNTGAYDKWLKEQQQQELANSYNAQKAALDNKYNNGGGLGGFLGSIVGGIGKGIGDVGYALGGMFGTAGASVGDLVGGIGKGITTGDWNISDENARAFKRTYYGAKDDKDAAAKAAGNSLNAATTLATAAIPGAAGAGSVAGKALGGVAANTIGGAIGGVADEFAQQGSDANFESAMNRALSGAASGAVAGKVGSKIGNAKSGIGKALLNNNIATSTIGRGAISGAVGGATGGATSAALGGGDVLGSAIEGAKSGAISGGVQAGVTSAAKSLVDTTAGKAIRNGWDKQKERIANAEKQAKPVAQETAPQVAKSSSPIDEYAMAHRPNEFGNFAYDLTNSNNVPEIDTAAPNDVYDNPQYYIFSGSDKARAEAADAVRALKGVSPDQMVKIYRATPGDTINPGDWITLSKEYANDHKNSWLEGKGNVIEMEVPARDIRWAGDDLQEWGYFPQKQKYYHGTPDGTFTEFRDGSYFTTSPEYAAKYMDTAASEISTGKKSINPMVYEVELNNKKPFDIMNDPEARRIYIDEYIKGGNAIGINPYQPDSEYKKIQDVDWTEVQDLADFLADQGYNYDSIIGNEGGYFDENGNIVNRGRSVKLFNGADAVLSQDTLGKINQFNQKSAQPQPIVETPTNYEQSILPDYTTPVDYQGNELKIRNRNLVEKVGSILSGAGEAIKNADVYNSLYSKTANRVTRNDSINKLRQIGFEPDNYAEAAKISTTTNKFVDDIVKNSGAIVTDNKFAEKIMTPDDNIIISDPTYLKKYNTKVRQLLDRIETGDYPGQYKASDLLKESRQFGEWANDLRKKSTNVNGDVTNRDGYELADAYTDVKYALRDLASQAVDGFGDNYTKSQLSERLTKLGAPKEAINYMLSADDIGGFIRNTSLFEDARQMAREMAETKVRRNAVAGSSTNPATIALNAAGVPQLLKAGLTPIGKVSGGLAKGIGETMQSIGSRLPEGGQSNLTPQAQLLLGNYIGRTQGLSQANQINTEAQKARDYQNLEQLLMEAQAAEMPEYQQQPSANAIKLQSQINQTRGMMEQALAMGDLSAYSKLQTVYNQLANAYKNEMPSTDNGMTVSQKNKLAKLQNASDALDQLSQLYSTAGGAQGITGNVANWLSGVGLNDNLNNYNKSVKTLINQISSAIGSSVSTDLIPRATDSEAEAQNKIETLRQLIAQASGNYSQIYGA